MTESARTVAHAKQLIKDCPEVWDQTCHLTEAAFTALATRLAAALQEEQERCARIAGDGMIEMNAGYFDRHQMVLVNGTRKAIAQAIRRAREGEE